MAAIAHSPVQRLSLFTRFLLFAVALNSPALVCADQASDIRAQLGVVTSALSEGNPAEAMTVFDKSFRDYQKLSGSFQALTSAFQVGSEIDVTDENNDTNSADLTLTWTLTLTDQKTAYSERRTSEEHVRFLLLDGKWRIVELSPLTLFSPQRQP